MPTATTIAAPSGIYKWNGEVIPTSTRTYAETLRLANSTTSSCREAGLATPQTLKVSHEVSKNGLGRNSVIILTDTFQDDDLATFGKITVQLKVSSDLAIATPERIGNLIGVLLELVAHSDTATTELADEAVQVQPIQLTHFINAEH